MRAAVLACVVVAAAVAGLVGSAFWIETSRAREASAPAIELGELVEAPARYDGMRLTVEAPVGAVLRPDALVLGAKDPARGLLVIAPEAARVAEGAVVRATGAVELRATGPVLLATALGAGES